MNSSEIIQEFLWFILSTLHNIDIISNKKLKMCPIFFRFFFYKEAGINLRNTNNPCKMYKSLPDSQICLMVPGPNIWVWGSTLLWIISTKLMMSECSLMPLRGHFLIAFSGFWPSLQDVLLSLSCHVLWLLLTLAPLNYCSLPPTHKHTQGSGSWVTPSSDPFLSAQGPPEARTLFLPLSPTIPFCIWNLCTYRLHILQGTLPHPFLSHGTSSVFSFLL